MLDIKKFRSGDFNYNFNLQNGYTELWGKTKEEDPVVAPFPIILDFEITEICKGPGGKPCEFCYKSNEPNKGSYTSLEKAMLVIDKMPKGLTQIAFGVDAQCESNPHWFEIFKYAREKNYIPNVTVADINDETAQKLASICGAVAVSRYKNKEFCYNSIDKLAKAGLKQINMHILLSKESLPWIYETLHDCKIDTRLQSLNAIVFLSLKQKGRGIHFNRVSDNEFKSLINTVQSQKIGYGFDSCSAHRFINCLTNENKELIQYVEPCESSLQSSYINVHGEYFPCSFTEGTEGWEQGIEITEETDFVQDIWNNKRTKLFRKKLLNNCRNCPVYLI